MSSVLRESEVVFMYNALAEAYEAYGATFVAWGSSRSPEAVRRHHEMGIRCSGSMWCLTAGAKRLHDDPLLLESVARDIEGKAVEVPWLEDIVWEGTKSYFGCTNNPHFRAHNRQRVRRGMAGGADSLHVDDHMGVAHAAVWRGGGLCDFCIAAFRDWLGEHVEAAELHDAGVGDLKNFDYRDIVRKFAATRQQYMEVQAKIPLMDKFLQFHMEAAAENVRQLGEVGAEAAGHPILLSANAPLAIWQHRVVLPHLTHVVCEVFQNARAGASHIDEALDAYEHATKAGKPLAATAAGLDWAFVKATGCIELVRFWIALAYAHGQRFMTPHPVKQWCWTQELGTHWYPAPVEPYAPMYRFIRANAAIFDDFATADASGIAAPPQTHCTLRRKGDVSILHVLNQDYQSSGDRFVVRNNVTISIPKVALGGAHKATVLAFDAAPAAAELRDAGANVELTLNELRVWSLVKIE